MELTLFLIALALYCKSCTSIRCYQCVPELTYTTVEAKCEHFDGSDRFIIDCPKSSMCYKRVSELELANDITSKSYHRGCAAQTISGDQKKINGTWRPVDDIHDVYDEDCKPDATDADRVTKTLHCYCRGELCNGSTSPFTNFNTTLSVIIAYLAIKCTSFS